MSVSEFLRGNPHLRRHCERVKRAWQSIFFVILSEARSEISLF
ncbi:hypothetical protein [Helicobacter sp. T3_23-1056]